MLNEVGGKNDTVSQQFSVETARSLIIKSNFLCRKPSKSRTNGRDYNILVNWINCLEKNLHKDRRQVLSRDQGTRLSLDMVRHTNSPALFHYIQKQNLKRREG